MLITILVLQIITLVFGVLPVAFLFTYLIYDFRRESKEKRAAQIKAREVVNEDEEQK